MRKIALKPEDVSLSLSLGTSLDHLVTIWGDWCGIGAALEGTNTSFWGAHSSRSLTSFLPV